MKSIKYVSPHGEAEPLHLAGVDIYPEQPFTVSDELAAEYFESPRFVDVTTGENPNFTCTNCGKPALQDGIFDPLLARMSNSPIRSLIRPDGRRVCAECVGTLTQPAIQPEYIPTIHEPDEPDDSHDIDDD